MTSISTSWATTLLNRRSAGSQLALVDLCRDLDAALNSGLDIDEPALSMRLLGPQFSGLSLLCQVVQASARHLSQENFASLIDVLISRGAKMDDSQQDPLEQLIESIDHDEMVSGTQTLVKILLDRGVDLPALVDRRGEQWLQVTLEKQGEVDLVGFLIEQHKLLSEHRDLEFSTPATKKSVSFPRL